MGSFPIMETKYTLVSKSPDETLEIGRLLGMQTQPGDIILLTGQLGSGKTVLTQGIAIGLEVKERPRSATFILISEYQGRLPFFHLDLYRIERADEALNLGLGEYIDGEGVTVVEWADRALTVFPTERLDIQMELVDEQTRSLVINPHGKRYKELVKSGLQFYQTNNADILHEVRRTRNP
ncbi:tRNA (adenosine(37)-N6)-threonylcarbamoyltransferase complex ATPase subunit type 1 TsaE [SAR202 cluster bacterium AD-802-E10_MRT_200m]|nr:tRNA (adenosine(37)-N6)-threonylcarbamoyltransferase complex ATPase subunit type 1 TsaE [SAR202 cluster bacterium AD-802-E10_MRT_200m]